MSIRSRSLRAAACGACALLAVALVGSCAEKPTEPTLPVEKSLKIAFVSARDGNAEIYVMNADGTQQTRLTNNAGDDGPFAWSPDGSRICYVSEQPGLTGIYVMNADGTDQKPLTQIRDNERTKPVWRSDGRKIVFSAYTGTSYEVLAMNADGTDLTNLTQSPGDDFDPTWSPDGLRIAFVVQDSLLDGSLWRGVCIMSADGTGIDTVAATTCPPPNDPGCSTYSNTLWSPVDNAVDAVAYMATVSLYVDICRTYHGLLTSPPGYQNRDPAWSPDGSKLAFVSNRSGAFEIHVMEADGANKTRLTNSAGGALGARWPSWSPDGSKLVYALDESGNYEIYINDVTQRRLTNNTALDMLPSCAMSR